MPSNSVSSAAAAPRKPLSKSTLYVVSRRTPFSSFSSWSSKVGVKIERKKQASTTRNTTRRGGASRLDSPKSTLLAVLNQRLRRLGSRASASASSAVSFSLACFHSEE